MSDSHPTRRAPRSGGKGTGPRSGDRRSGGDVPKRIGRYTVQGELGRGGMGVVYLARDTRLDRAVALKALPSSLVEGAEGRERLEREARLLAALEHPHVAAIYGIEAARGRSFLVLQHVPGESLARRLARGPLPVAEALGIARQIASGLAAAHRRGIVHCDLKPSNVMLAPEGADGSGVTVKLVDFGIATRFRGTEWSTERTEVTGTPGYMSPEQVRGEALDPRTDAWSFGCVVLECLTGRPAFTGDEPFERVRAVLLDEADWSGLPDGVAPSVRELIRSCLRKDREQRAADMDAIRAELESARAEPARRRRPMPRPLTSFIGRADELAHVDGLLRRARLVTLVGAAGCGKTRLAIEAAARAGDRLGGEAVFVALAPLADESLVEGAVASALGVREAGGTLADAIVADLREGKALLVLDNCEHLLAATSRLVERLLSECPGLVVTCTSREALGVAGEQAWRVPSLAHPGARARADFDAIVASDGVRFFVQRAAEAVPSFALTEGNAPSVAALVARLDGIPLALELAASRLKILSIDQILERLSDRFRLLTGGSRTALERHQTLRAALDWSYELLDDREKRCLRELSVFAGGFRLEEAARTCTGDEFDVLDLVSHLVDKSLVQSESDATSSPRYRLLESVRQHAALKLEESGEAHAARSRHRDAFVALAAELEREVASRTTSRGIRLAEAEMDNFRAAIEWSLAEPGGGRAALELCGALVGAWDQMGAWREGREWLERALAASGERDRAWARATDGLGRMLWWLGDSEGTQRHAEAALAAFEEHGDQSGAAGALMHVAMSRHSRGDLEGARRGYEAAAERFHAAGIARSVADALLNSAIIARDTGRADDAERLAREALALIPPRDHRQARALMQLGVLARDRGDYDAAQELIERALAMHVERGARREIVDCELELGHVARLRGDLETARRLYTATAATHREMGDPRRTAQSLANLAATELSLGLRTEARAGLLQALRLAVSTKARSLVAGIAEELASVQADEDAAAATRLFAACDQALAAMGRRASGAEQRMREALVATLREALGDAFDAAWAEGVAAGLDAQVAALLAPPEG